MNHLNILYLEPEQIRPENINLLSGFNRISNFLNMKIKKLSGSIQEEFVKLDFENLPSFVPKNIQEYRSALKRLLDRLYTKFHFNLVAISCYSSHHYLNTIEVTNIIKYKINPDCFIVIGGPHASICPEDFQYSKIPSYLRKTFPENKSPIDFIIKGEGEIPFYRLVKSFLNSDNSARASHNSSIKILKSENLTDLNTLPLIDFGLYQKYAKNIEKVDRIVIDFMRGCPFRCNICSNGADFLPCYKNVRYKQIDKCIEEIKGLIELDWLKVKNLWITDPTFFPKRRFREEFFEKLWKVKVEYGELPFRFLVWDRVDTCHLKKDIEKYAEFNIDAYIGMESASPKLLRIMGKTKSTDKNGSNARHYIKKIEDLIIRSNKLNVSLIFGLIIGCPGSTLTTFKENEKFFLKKRFNGRSLVDKYIVDLKFGKYLPLLGEKLTYECESSYNAKIYYKEWWKEFDKDQMVLASTVEPNNIFSLEKCLNLNYRFIKEIFETQINKNIKYYSIGRLLKIKLFYEKIKQKIPKEIYPESM